MRSRLLVSVCVALLLFATPVFAALPAQPAVPRTPAPQPQPVSLTKFDYPRQVTAGQTITFNVEMEASQEGGVCCGNLSLKGPSGQYAYVELARSGPGSLTGSHRFSAYTEPGTWTIMHLSVRTSTWNELKVTNNFAWNQSFTVTSSGKADTSGPKLLSLEVPTAVTAGEIYEIKLKAQDDLSGVDIAYATVQPAMPRGAGEEVPTMRAPWQRTVTLRPSGNPGELVGGMLMEFPVHASSRLEVAAVQLPDKAGNATFLGLKELAEAKFPTVTAARFREVPEGLVTNPFLHVLHPGRLAYQHWLEVDRAYLVALAKEVSTDRQAVREHLLAELSQLRAVLDQVRTEVYTDPASGLRVVPFATTGKWLVLDRAIVHRTFLLSSIGPDRQQLLPADVEALRSAIERAYRVGERLIPLEGSQVTYSQVAAAYLHQLGNSPELVAALKTPAYQVAEQTPLDELENGLVYFMPVETNWAYPKLSGRAILRIPAVTNASMAQVLGGLFYQVGLHLGDAYFSSTQDPDRAKWWEPYVTLRGGQNWVEEVLKETPATNLATDFAQTFLPEGIEFRLNRSYPELKPETTKAFRSMVTGLLERTPSPVALSTHSYVQVGVAERMTLSVTAPGGDSSLVLLRKAYAVEALNLAIAGTLADRATRFDSQPQEMGEPYWHLLRVTDKEWRNQFWVLTYIQAPVLLDPLPSGTNKPVITVSGSALPGQLVTIGATSVTADDKGRFAIDVPLKPGENLLRVSVAKVKLGTRIRVTYQPEGSPIPVSSDLPATSKSPFVFGHMETVPYAIVRLDNMERQADANGSMALGQWLKPGVNVIKAVVTDRYGNATTWETRVTLEQ